MLALSGKRRKPRGDLQPLPADAGYARAACLSCLCSVYMAAICCRSKVVRPLLTAGLFGISSQNAGRRIAPHDRLLTGFIPLLWRLRKGPAA